jgi:hypothetical protein
VGEIVMDVVRIEEGDEHIHVEQGGPPADVIVLRT